MQRLLKALIHEQPFSPWIVKDVKEIWDYGRLSRKWPKT
jgi:hypothetical protein